ncbi:MAG: hypothetical protein HQK87_00515 [Nitrospinae bacterium]|nr:hypothetical protein [Nitrospinota bacterium]
MYVRFDLSDDLGAAIAKEVAAGYGVADIFAYARRTGFIVLVDAKTKKAVETLDITMSADRMRQAIRAAARRSGA